MSGSPLQYTVWLFVLSGAAMAIYGFARTADDLADELRDVFVGMLMLLFITIRIMRGHFTPERHFGFEGAAWYWHFVDVVWLFLFMCIYVWGAGVPAPH